jgi:hypothetical protein
MVARTPLLEEELPTMRLTHEDENSFEMWRTFDLPPGAAGAARLKDTVWSFLENPAQLSEWYDPIFGCVVTQEGLIDDCPLYKANLLVVRLLVLLAVFGKQPGELLAQWRKTISEFW